MILEKTNKKQASLRMHAKG